MPRFPVMPFTLKQHDQKEKNETVFRAARVMHMHMGMHILVIMVPKAVMVKRPFLCFPLF